MNILPLVLALLLTLTVLTVQKAEMFKNQIVIQKTYQQFLQQNAHETFNRFQEKIREGEYDLATAQVNFKVFVNKEDYNQAVKDNTLAAYRFLAVEIMRAAYSEAFFYKEIEAKRPEFLSEIVRGLEKVHEIDHQTVKCAEDFARIKFNDPELQYVFYLMLKGSCSRQQLQQLEAEKLKGSANFSERLLGKSYPSLLEFVRYEKRELKIALCPRQTLKAIFGQDELVDQFIARRFELSQLKKGSDEKQNLQAEFKDKIRPELANLPIDYMMRQPKYDANTYN